MTNLRILFDFVMVKFDSNYGFYFVLSCLLTHFLLHKFTSPQPPRNFFQNLLAKTDKAPKKISLKPISHHQASAIVVKPRVIVAQKALSIELKAFVGKQLCAQSRTHHAFIALIFVF